VVRASFLAGVLLLLGAFRADAAELLSLSVRFTWDGVKGNEFTTDRGFTVRLDSADVVSAGFALVPCAEQGAQLGSSIVRVGHFSGVLPNQLPLERTESLIERSPFAIDGFDPPDIAYCQAHYVLGGPRGGHSLKMEGSYRAAGAENWTKFSVATPEAYGAFVPLLSIQRRAMKGRLGAIRSLTVQRPASGWFDGIDFAGADGTQIGRAVLRRIANGTAVTVQR
jgi:hypothetical protein